MNNRFVILLLFVITFIAGGISGYILRAPVNEKITETRADRTRPDQPGERQIQREQRFREHVTKELELTAEQQELFFKVLAEQRRAMREVWEASRREHNAQMRAQHQKLLDELDDFLTAEQLEKWEIMSRRAMNGGQRPGPNQQRGRRNL